MAALLTYVASRSSSLDDFDSFNFARAIERFDPLANQPQPPGYPVYVFLARLVNLVTGEPGLSLTLLSAVCGALTVLLVGLLARDLGVPWAVLPLAVCPLMWLSSGMALSDVPGLLLMVAAVWPMVRAVDVAPPWRMRCLVAAALAAALATGVRPQNLVVPLGVGVLWLVPTARLRWREAAWMAIAFGAGCLLWAVPLALAYPSLGTAAASLLGQSQYVGSTDSLLARPLSAPNVWQRLAEFGDAFSAYLGGPTDAGAAAFAVLYGLSLIAGLVTLRRRATQVALAWLLPYSLLMVLTLRPDDPRKLLPVFPALFLLLGSVLRGWRGVQLSSALGCIGAALWLGWLSLPLVRTLHTVPAPPEQAAVYIAQHFSAADTLVVAGLSYNAVRYRQPEFQTVLIDSGQELPSSYQYVVVLDKEGPALPDGYGGSASITFARDPLVLPKAASVLLTAYARVSGGPELQLPSSGLIRVGLPEAVPYLQAGWYRPELVAGVAARWSDNRAGLRFWLPAAASSQLRLVGAAYPAGQQLTVRVNGQVAARLAMVGGWAPYNISVPAALLQAGALNTISLEHSMTISAFEATAGLSLDKRPLAAAYSDIELRPA